MKKIKSLVLIMLLILVGFFAFRYGKKIDINTEYEVGQALDSLNGVVVYYNGGVSHVGKRNVSKDGYNIGMEYQCVEFVKRYYFNHYKHKMPDSYGNAKDFFQSGLKDGSINASRDLRQYSNPSKQSPQVGDLVVYGPSLTNKYGHVSIVSKVYTGEIEVIQQNPGPFGESRESIRVTTDNDKWLIENNRILGWLRKE